MPAATCHACTATRTRAAPTPRVPRCPRAPSSTTGAAAGTGTGTHRRLVAPRPCTTSRCNRRALHLDVHTLQGGPTAATTPRPTPHTGPLRTALFLHAGIRTRGCTTPTWHLPSPTAALAPTATPPPGRHCLRGASPRLHLHWPLLFDAAATVTAGSGCRALCAGRGRWWRRSGSSPSTRARLRQVALQVCHGASHGRTTRLAGRHKLAGDMELQVHVTVLAAIPPLLRAALAHRRVVQHLARGRWQ